ncbi:hypothetical protein AMS68_001422 [Peltaster fructicola]|uniref:LIM zinc-binding domain-containing protein n=1 Tax=Peltaster fructicola TaxID=286661 RepID=A0A6H0XMP5_9PEZI|nr:hypothetical protein AMS68_001422 [Peltaster fructicola]
MSLAATLSASGMRPASFLPAIKCSSCGEEIEIARMGEHICGPAPPQQNRPAPAALSNPYSPPQWNAPQQHQASSPLQHAHSPSDAMIQSHTLAPATTGSSRSAKPSMPPRINPDAANRPFLAPSYPRSASPASPVLSIRSGRSGSSNGSRPPMLRTMTMPINLRDRSPSPEMASNLDCAFPSFPTSTSRPGTSNGRKTPTPSERAPSRSGLRPGQEAFAIEPRSPRATGGESVMKKANTLRSGPFDAGRRKTSREEKAAVPALPSSIAVPNPFPLREPSPERMEQLPARKASLPQETPSMNNFHEEPSGNVSSKVPVPLRLTERSNTFPLPPGSEHEEPRSPGFPRRPSEPAVRGRDRRPSIAASMRSESRPRQYEAVVRPQSRNGPRTDPRLQDAPPVPKPVQQYRQPSKHAPSESASSASSISPSYSNTNSSEGPSPISSAASSVDLFSPISQASAHERDERPKSIGRSAGYSTRSQQQNPGLRAEQPAKRASPPNFARPRPHGAGGAATQPQLQSMNELVESPEDLESDDWSSSRAPLADAWPALSIPSNDYDPYKPPSPNPTTRSRSKSNASEYSLYEPDPVSSVPLPPMPTAPLRPIQRRNTSAKPICRGCNLVIEGKSVKAADGRLTGRWHKQCFTCRTCSQPFATADFYVINDQPYCKQHYHEKNGSVCSGCQRGIEGQYLETSNHNASGAPRRKFHPTCFTCCECRIILSNDYFEINGKPYCERHAYIAKRGQAAPGAYHRPGPGGLHPPSRRELTAERRTTKLMMM